MVDKVEYLLYLFNDLKTTPLLIWESQNMELLKKPVQSTQVPYNRGFSLNWTQNRLKLANLVSSELIELWI